MRLLFRITFAQMLSFRTRRLKHITFSTSNKHTINEVTSHSTEWKWRHYWLKFITEIEFLNVSISISDWTSIWFFKMKWKTKKKKSPISFESESTIVFQSTVCYIRLMNKHINKMTITENDIEIFWTKNLSELFMSINFQ